MVLIFYKYKIIIKLYYKWMNLIFKILINEHILCGLAVLIERLLRTLQ